MRNKGVAPVSDSSSGDSNPRQEGPADLRLVPPALAAWVTAAVTLDAPAVWVTALALICAAVAGVLLLGGATRGAHGRTEPPRPPLHPSTAGIGATATPPSSQSVLAPASYVRGRCAAVRRRVRGLGRPARRGSDARACSRACPGIRPGDGRVGGDGRPAADTPPGAGGPLGSLLRRHRRRCAESRRAGRVLGWRRDAGAYTGPGPRRRGPRRRGEDAVAVAPAQHAAGRARRAGTRVGRMEAGSRPSSASGGTRARGSSVRPPRLSGSRGS